MRTSIEPALHFQWYMTEAARSAVRNGGKWKNTPLLEIAYIMDQVGDEYDMPGLPPVVKRILFRTLARLAVLLRKTGEIAPLVKTQKVT